MSDRHEPILVFPAQPEVPTADTEDGRGSSATEETEDNPDSLATKLQAIEPRAIESRVIEPQVIEPQVIEPQAPSFASRQILGPYRLGRLLGAGGMGLVFEAVDEELRQQVALKLLPTLQPRRLFRLKQEFRSLAGVSHHNLVTLYELMCVDHVWFIAMELIRGVDWLSFVRGSERRRRPAPLSAEEEVRLRATLPQIIDGIDHLHQCRLLHLDLKPENILVTEEGRVVVLDFGLTESLGRDGLVGPWRSGTPSYMSPEQCLAQPMGPASDWYALGVMLYEALTGAPPFPGPPEESMRRRCQQDPIDPRTRFAELPAELPELCLELLRREPEQRPAGASLLARFRASPRSAAGEPRVKPSLPFIGRQEQLARLRQARTEAEAGRCVVVEVRGSSGIGKTALVREFLREASDASSALVLSGRCHERETVPYKGFDSVLDSLYTHLRLLTAEELGALLDEGEWCDLATAFPVLGALPALPPRSPPSSGELGSLSAERRQRAFGGLRKLLDGLRRQGQVVVFIDDMQWADADSMALLAALLAPPQPPALLMLFTVNRDSERRDSPWATLRAQQRIDYVPISMELAALPAEHAEQLATTLLGERSSAALCQTIVQESGGSPFFIEQLAHASGPSAPRVSAVGREYSVEQLIIEQAAALPPSSRRVLELTALAGRPLAQRVVFQAAGIMTDSVPTLLQLRGTSLLRSAGLRDSDVLELYHHRMRDCVLGTMSEMERQQRHGELAQALCQAGASADLLAYHYHGARELPRASEYAEQAGREAAEVLAFEQAANFYRDALSWHAGPSERVRRLNQHRGTALLSAGRGAEAAEAFLAAAEHETGLARQERLRQAADAYLIAGYVENGLSIIEPLLRELEGSYTASSARMKWEVAKYFLQLRLRAIAITERPHREPTPRELFALDLYWALGRGVCNVLPWQGMAFMLRSLRDALRIGEPVRIARSLWYFGAVLVILGDGRSAYGEKCLEQTAEFGRRTSAPALIGQSRIGLSMRSLLRGRWSEALTFADEGLALMKDGPGLHWERASCACNALVALEQLGQVQEVGRRAEALWTEAIGRGDLYVQCVFSEFAAMCRVAAGDTEQARRHAQWVVEHWTQRTYTLQHFYAMRIQAYCDLYDDRVEEATRRTDASWSQLRRSDLYSVSLSRFEILLLRGRVALRAAAVASSKRASRMLQAARVVAALQREPRPDGKAHAALLRAGLAALSAKQRDATEQLEASARAFGALEMNLMAAAARWQLGQLQRDAAAVEQSAALMQSLGIAEPQAWCRCFLPGFAELAPGPQ